MAAGDVGVEITTPDARACAKFDGVDDEITINASDSINVNNHMSLALWVKPNDLNTWGIIRKSSGGTSDWNIYRDTGEGGKWRVEVYNSSDTGASTYSTSAPLTIETWTHIAFSFDGTNINLFTNGVADGSIALAGSVRNSAEALVIGSYFGFFAGNVKKVRLYNRALSAAEFLKLAQEIDSITNGLVGYWKLDTDYTDSSGNGNDGSNSGSIIGTYDGPIAKAVTDQRTAATDTFFLCDVNGGNQVLHTQITEA